jgi:hypothetical protein
MYIVLFAALATTLEAQAVGRRADVSIIDRDSGTTLQPYYWRGEYWVAGKPGAHYAIEIRSRLGERLLAVTSVDGINVISGETAGWGQTGYVFGAFERYQITGWRKSDAQVAAFTFTDSQGSYAERTGRPANIGVVGVALFREQPPRPPEPPMIAQSPLESDSAEAGKSAGNAARESRSMPAAPAAKLGTGHGEREYSSVTRTEFVRMQNSPDEIIRIHYDSFDNLLAMGIVRRPRPVPQNTDPFPASPEQAYVADPPG